MELVGALQFKLCNGVGLLTLPGAVATELAMTEQTFDSVNVAERIELLVLRAVVESVELGAFKVPTLMRPGRVQVSVKRWVILRLPLMYDSVKV